jgi:hypothetical protein
MGSVMCRKICLEFARPALMVKLGILLLNKIEVKPHQKEDLNFLFDLGFVCDKVLVTVPC